MSDPDRKGEQEKPGGIAEILGAIAAIPLGLLGCFLSLAVPGLVIFALINGPGRTWDAVSAWIPGRGGTESRESATVGDDCQEMRTWLATTVDRGNSLVEKMEDLNRAAQSQAPTRADMVALIEEIDDLGDAQERLVPPPSAKGVNDRVVNVYRLTVSSMRARLAGETGWSADVDEATALWPTVEAGQRSIMDRCNIPLIE
jgi:hypothetical protein